MLGDILLFVQYSATQVMYDVQDASNIITNTAINVRSSGKPFNLDDCKITHIYNCRHVNMTSVIIQLDHTHTHNCVIELAI